MAGIQIESLLLCCIQTKVYRLYRKLTIYGLGPKTSSFSHSFQHLPWDPGNVDALKAMLYPFVGGPVVRVFTFPPIYHSDLVQNKSFVLVCSLKAVHVYGFIDNEVHVHDLKDTKF